MPFTVNSASATILRGITFCSSFTFGGYRCRLDWSIWPSDNRHSITGNVSSFGVGVLITGRVRVGPCRYFAGQVPGRSVKFAADPWPGSGRPPAPTVLLSSSSYFMHPHSSCIHAHMQTYKADFYNALYVPPGSKPYKPYMRMLLTFAEILSTLRGCR